MVAETEPAKNSDMTAIGPKYLLAIVRRLGLPRRTFVYLFLLNLLGAGLDLLGVVLLLPILEIIQAGGGAAILATRSPYELGASPNCWIVHIVISSQGSTLVNE